MALFQLIAQEYRRYVLTRGFLLFLAIIPISIGFGALAGFLSEYAAPVRAFTVVDATGRYGTEIDRVLEQRHLRRVVSAWDAYVEGLEAVGDEEFDLPDPFAPDDNTPARRIAFAEAGGLEAANAAIAGQLPPDTPLAEEPKRNLRRVPPPADIEGLPLEQAAEALRPFLNGDAEIPGSDDGLFAAVLIPADFGPDGAEAQFWTQNLTDESLSDAVEEALTVALQRRAYEERGLSIQDVRAVDSIRAPFDRFKSNSETGEAVSVREELALYVPLGLAYILLAMVLSVGGMLLTSTVEEKSNKIVEVLLSSVTATELMVGKLIGLLLVGITAPVLFLLLGFIALTAFGGAGEVVSAFRAILFGSPLVPLFFFYFLLGYLMFASLYLAIGAMSQSIQDAQSFVTPITILLVLPLPFLQMVVTDPNGIVARILTWIPIYTPYAVMMRINADPPVWEIVGATLLLLAFTGALVFFMGRIYRNGVLSSGGAPKFTDALKLARTSSASA
ncbi:ABC transporter permease [Parvularcula oceani]|uniref:ABC transporter permease n=1 Tax=Parvularcula oceani TaxID=1247963 RepID=UPI0004E12186|nr:ABC transporter permease [Parvularcula oceani]